MVSFSVSLFLLVALVSDFASGPLVWLLVFCFDVDASFLLFVNSIGVLVSWMYCLMLSACRYGILVRVMLVFL